MLLEGMLQVKRDGAVSQPITGGEIDGRTVMPQLFPLYEFPAVVRKAGQGPAAEIDLHVV